MAFEFDTAAKRVVDDEPREREYDLVFPIHERDEDDEIVDTFEARAARPGDGVIAVLLTDIQGRRSTASDKVAGLIDFVMDVVDRPTRDYLVKRLLDEDDPFGTEAITEMAMALVEEWGGRPTKQPSDYAPSRKTGGQRSTRTTSRQTSSRSRSTGSSTRSTRSTSKAS